MRSSAAELIKSLYQRCVNLAPRLLADKITPDTDRQEVEIKLREHYAAIFEELRSHPDRFLNLPNRIDAQNSFFTRYCHVNRREKELDMRNNSKIITILVMTIITTAMLFVIKGQPQSAQDNQAKQPRRGETIEAADVNQFPVADYVAEKRRSGTETERTKREAKGKKYNSRHVPPISEFSDKVFSFIDWERGLSAFPFDRSSAVIIGEITEAEAHLSADETKIYSEFTVQVDEVLKNDQLFPLSPQSKITVERPGGRVRFPSGKVVVAAVSNQDLPHVGRRYVLFLTHDFIMGGRYNEELFILTGYELRGDHVYPLDKVSSGHPISAYKGIDKEAFLRDLTSALVSAL